MRLFSGRQLAAWTGRRKTMVAVVALVVALASVGALLMSGDLTRGSSGGGESQEQFAGDREGALSDGELEGDTLQKGKVNPADYGCWYPGVCFYKTKEDWKNRFPTALFKDPKLVQPLPEEQAVGSYMVLNSRQDDGALITLASKRTHCVKPGAWYRPGNEVTTVIQILDSDTCQKGKSATPGDTTLAVSGCRQPTICIYQTKGHLDAKKPTEVLYADHGYHRLDDRLMAYAILNTRRADIVILKMLDGTYRCVAPGGRFVVGADPDDETPIKSLTMSELMIKNMSTCPGAAELATQFKK